ncbi:hypothetical protein [Aeromicrobium sp. CTD01-1L150]|uniref:hypothetical protein n=1 Tax=Aeromicrobium sp. CTD01-1L150 TaxID=3341830 RepID=UPI0035BFF044
MRATEQRMDYHDLLTDIVAAEAGHQRDMLITEFFQLAHRDLFSMAHRFCSSFRVDRNTWADDCYAIILETANGLIEETIENPRMLEKLQSFVSLTQYRARYRITQFFESSAGTNPASGMNSMRRRRSELERDRAQMTQTMGRDPSPQEVVAATNDRMRATRKDAARQGMIATVADFDLHQVEDIDDYQEIAEPQTETRYLDRVDVRDALKKTVRLADRVSDELGAVARVWAEPMLLDLELELSSNRAIVERCQLSLAEVRTARQQLSQLLAGVLSDEHGVDVSAWAG